MKPGVCVPARLMQSASMRLPVPKWSPQEKCVGCKVCTIACPFGTINYAQATGKVVKCDLCGGDPQCAAACPTAAITYVDADWTGSQPDDGLGGEKPAFS